MIGPIAFSTTRKIVMFPMKRLSIVILPLCLILASCTATGPAEDTWDEELKNPRLIFSEKLQYDNDEQKKLGISDKKSKSRAASNKAAGASYSNSSYDVPAIDQKSFEDFEAFKAWRRAKQPGSADFQDYQDWQAYQQYRRFKAQKTKPAQ